MTQPRADDMIAEIQEIDRAAREALGQRADTVPARYQIQKVRYSHDAMIDIIIANPWVHQNHLAAHFGYSPAWISTVMATDMFQAKLAARKEEIIDPELRATVDERFRAVITRSLQVLQQKLSQPINQVPDNLALRAAELGAKALGLGGNAPARTTVVNMDARLLELSGRLTGLLQRQKQEAIDV